ncbi:putative protein BREVIS RADIX-like [Capsicum annuum]|nr:putative protein BREVIS RADIX-like [Capsicum annuum]
MEDDDIIVIDAEPTSHSLPPSTSATAVDLSFLREDDDVDSTFLSLPPPFSQDSAGIHAESISDSLPPPSSNSGATLSCWKKKILIHLSCLSLYLFMKTFQTPLCLRFNKFRRTLQNPLCLCFQNFLKTYLLRRILQTLLLLRLHRQCSIGSQDSSVLGNPSHKRCLFQESGEEKFFKKIKVTKDSWITKPLTKSDVNGCSRLLLPRRELKNYVLPFMDEEQQYTICNDSCGIDVTVFDVDTQTEHSLTFLLSKVWTPEFVKRRNLKEDDV